jgi:predicted nucleic acid-binding protein
MLTAYFMDSSALVKRYVSETGTDWIHELAAPQSQNRLIIARIAWVEVCSALARRQREGALSPEHVALTVDNLHYDLDTQYQIVELDRAVMELAGQLVARHPLRAYDAVQLASALCILPAFAHAQSTSLVFVAADDYLLAAAQAEGLRTENPNHHRQRTG